MSRCRCSRTSAVAAIIRARSICHITATNERTHEIIRAGCDRSPMFTGVIEGVGPRYCPSVEDKVHRFADKTSHQIFIEPEGLTTHEIYPNGISTSLPFDVQLELVRSIKGFENAHITRPGYAIEYDYFDPRDLQLQPGDEVHRRPVLRRPDQWHDRLRRSRGAGHCSPASMPRCWCRNAKPGRRVATRPTSACSSTILITRGTSEPYRMFTSRAEYRLLLREDNADLRLTPKGRELGLVDDERWQFFSAKRDAHRARKSHAWMRRSFIRITSMSSDRSSCSARPLTREAHAFDLLRRPEVSYAALTSLDAVERAEWMNAADADERLVEQVQLQVEVQAKYTGYIDRQQRSKSSGSAATKKLRLPDDIDYAQVRGLVDRSAAAPAGSTARDGRSGSARAGRDAGRDFAAAGPPEASSGCSLTARRLIERLSRNSKLLHKLRKVRSARRAVRKVPALRSMFAAEHRRCDPFVVSLKGHCYVLLTSTDLHAHDLVRHLCLHRVRPVLLAAASRERSAS